MKNGTWIAQMRKGCAEYSILITLNVREAYGYEILQRLSKCTPLAQGESTVYPLLSRLTQEGYLTVRVRNSSTGPPRRYYRLTTAGRERLLAMHEYWGNLVQSMTTIREENSHDKQHA